MDNQKELQEELQEEQQAATEQQEEKKETGKQRGRKRLIAAPAPCPGSRRGCCILVLWTGWGKRRLAGSASWR